MFRPELRRVALRLSVLGVLLSCLLAAGTLSGAKAGATSDRTMIICCSACEVENPPLACQHGCSPSCAK